MLSFNWWQIRLIVVTFCSWSSWRLQINWSNFWKENHFRSWSIYTAFDKLGQYLRKITFGENHVVHNFNILNDIVAHVGQTKHSSCLIISALLSCRWAEVMKSRNLDSYTRLGLWDLRLKIFLIFSKEGYFCNDVSKMYKFDVVIKPCWIAAPICIQLIPSRTHTSSKISETIWRCCWCEEELKIRGNCKFETPPLCPRAKTSEWLFNEGSLASPHSQRILLRLVQSVII